MAGFERKSGFWLLSKVGRRRSFCGEGSPADQKEEERKVKVELLDT
jgi:hypothetical protein